MANLINRLYELQKLKLACKILFSDCQVLPLYLKYTAKYKVQKSGFSLYLVQPYTFWALVEQEPAIYSYYHCGTK